jgi:hypothetical protein
MPPEGRLNHVTLTIRGPGVEDRVRSTSPFTKMAQPLGIDLGECHEKAFSMETRLWTRPGHSPAGGSRSTALPCAFRARAAA